MLFDGHVYCFPPLTGLGWGRPVSPPTRHLQQAMATHFQPTWRASDRSDADELALINPAGWPRLDSL